ncbi:uncharacterized protein LOC125478812 [Pyrus x bretschneideri]|uniref:uncharacterized protein LOC125478812 n=1 Tax=Pyrus x bretschneideri TaxID=225117 RepID=UPI00202F1702|nr:uncharacterized protein LOC125478812 [Pyrus x bretschneideri]
MSSSRRVYTQFEEQHKRLLAQQEELVNLEEGEGGDETLAMEEDEDDDYGRHRASHSHHVMEVVGQISKPIRSANFDRKREIRGLIPEQKVTATLQILAYGVSADKVDEITRMRKSTVLESLMLFCSAIEALYTKEYLRKQTHRDLRRVLRKGAQNDLNVLTQSPVFDEVLQGKAPRVTYSVNGHTYDEPYYLADDIYPRWTTFVKTVPHPKNEKETLCKMLKGV